MGEIVSYPGFVASQEIWLVKGARLFVRDEIVEYLFDHGGAIAQAGAERDGRLKVIPAA